MPNETTHLAIANHNQQLIELLLPHINDYADWITTVAFYKALHIVEAVLSNDNTIRHGIDHQSRENILKRNSKYKHIYTYYRPLYAASLVARYLSDGYSSFSDYLSPTDVRAKVLGHYLHQIEQSSQRFLRNPASLSRVQLSPVAVRAGDPPTSLS